MFGSVKNGTMDSIEFAKDFLAAFDVHIVNYNINVDSGRQSWTGPSGMAMSQNSPPVATIHVSCKAVTLPTSDTFIHYFSVGPNLEHALVEVKTSSRCDELTCQVIHDIDLTYKTINLDKFMYDLKNVAYSRYSDKFHKQLDDILD